MNEKEIFAEVVNNFANKYPSRGIALVNKPYGVCVVVDGEVRFNTDGYNLLFNLKRLCKCLDEELE